MVQDCDCVKSVENKVIDMINNQKDKYKDYKVINSEWEHCTIYPVQRLYCNYMIKYTFQKKDGSVSQPRNEHVRINFNYCPFCGKKYESLQATKE
jgi:hypothetical protein